MAGRVSSAVVTAPRSTELLGGLTALVWNQFRTLDQSIPGAYPIGRLWYLVIINAALPAYKRKGQECEIRRLQSPAAERRRSISKDADRPKRPLARRHELIGASLD
jgi:hypothetical protein